MNNTINKNIFTLEATAISNLFNQIYDTVLNSVTDVEEVLKSLSFSNIKQNFDLPIGGAVKFVSESGFKVIVANTGETTIVLFQKVTETNSLPGFCLTETVEGNFINGTLTIEDMCYVKNSIDYSLKVGEQINNHSTQEVEDTTFNKEELQEFFKKPVVSEMEQTQPETIVETEKVAPPETFIPEELLVVAKTTTFTHTPTETPFYKKKSFWIGAGTGVVVGAGVAWRIRSKLS